MLKFQVLKMKVYSHRNAKHIQWDNIINVRVKSLFFYIGSILSTNRLNIFYKNQYILMFRVSKQNRFFAV